MNRVRKGRKRGRKWEIKVRQTKEGKKDKGEIRGPSSRHLLPALGGGDLWRMGLGRSQVFEGDGSPRCASMGKGLCSGNQIPFPATLNCFTEGECRPSDGA